jgi:hypothetical protein
LRPAPALGKAALKARTFRNAAMSLSAIGMILLFIIVMGALNWYEFGRVD